MTSETRQDPPSLGNPRLIFALDGRGWTHEPQREFALVDDVTTVGSAEDADLRLEGLEPMHAEIRHDEADDYTYVRLGAPRTGTVHGRTDGRAVLRTGTRIEFGDWTVSFHREEFADGNTPADSPVGQRFARMRDEAHPGTTD